MTKRIPRALVPVLALLFVSAAMAGEPAAPTITASVSRRNVTAAIPNTTLFTPAYTGVFRVSVYADVTAPADDGRWTINWHWSDDAGAESVALASAQASQTPPDASFTEAGFSFPPGSFVFEAVAGQPVSFSLQTTGAVGACSFSIVVERLK